MSFISQFNYNKDVISNDPGGLNSPATFTFKPEIGATVNFECSNSRWFAGNF